MIFFRVNKYHSLKQWVAILGIFYLFVVFSNNNTISHYVNVKYDQFSIWC